MLGPAPSENLDPRAEPETRRWLLVGTAPGALERLPPEVVAERARDVHEALGALNARPFHRVLVAGAALAERPRAALRALKAAAPRDGLTVLGRTLPAAVTRAARALEVPTAHDAAAAPPPPPGPPAVPAPSLPRADRGLRSAQGIDPGRFAEGCLARLARPGALAGFLLRTLAEASDASRVSLMLTDPGGRSLVLRAARGLDAALLGKVRIPLGSGVAGRAAALGRPVTGHGSPGGARKYPGGTYVVLPLGGEGACEGVVNLTGFPDDALPSPEALEAWVRIVKRAGQALRSARRLRRAEARSARDALTGLPNRRAFERALLRESERARRAGRGLGVAILDVDRFKVLNDTHGHDAGDRALAEVARRLAGALRDSDLVARWGGEEFAVLLPDLAPSAVPEARAALERARQAVGSRPIPLGLGLPSVVVTVSGGVAVGPGPGTDGAALLHAADQALLKAKQAGRDRLLDATSSA